MLHAIEKYLEYLRSVRNSSPHTVLKSGADFIVEKKSKSGMVRSCIKEGCDWEKLIDEPKPAETPEPAVVKV